MLRRVAQPGSASALGAEGRRFESCLSDHFDKTFSANDMAVFKLAPTSSLILLWAGQTPYKSSRARSYLDILDLSPGKALLEKYSCIWEDYGQLILNRKFALYKFWLEYLKRIPTAQVVLLAAGVDPIGLDIIEAFPDATIFDVDLDNRELKEDLFQKVGAPKNIHICKADLTQTEELLKVLEESGWEPHRPTLLIAEGISYYVGKSEFNKTIMSLLTLNGAFIFEYAIPAQQVCKERRHIPEQVFGQLEEDYALPPMSMYSLNEVDAFALSLQHSLDLKKPSPCLRLGQKQIEKERTGKNTYFPQENQGWIYVSFIPFFESDTLD